MPLFKAKNLSSLLSAVKSTTKFTTKPSSLTKPTTKPSSLTSPAPTTTEDRPLKPFVSSFNSKAPLLSTSATNFSHDSPKLTYTETTVDFSVAREGLLSSVDASVSRGTNNANALETVLGIPCFSTESNNNISQLQKEVLHERRQKWIFKNTPTYRFEKFANLCANKIGTDATLNLFGRLWRETSLKEYNLSIRICIERAMGCDHEDAALEQICQAFQLFNFMKEQGFQLEEETYGPLLRYLIDMSMIEEFYFFRKAIESGNSRSDPRLDYYEMLLWITVNKEENIQNFFKCTAIDNERDCFNLKAAIDYEGDYLNFLENNLLALCESKQNSDFLQYLETMVITKDSSLDHMMSIFKLLGRLVLESFAEKNLLALKISGFGAENVSNVIFSYTSGIPNLEVEDIISKFRDLHAMLEIKPSSASYEKLIAYTCDLDTEVALDLVDEMSEAGLTLSIDTVNSFLIACEKNLMVYPVRRIYLIICHHNLKPNSETFRCMISLSMGMEDFDGAYAMLCDGKKMNLMLTADMYNANGWVFS